MSNARHDAPDDGQTSIARISHGQTSRFMRRGVSVYHIRKGSRIVWTPNGKRHVGGRHVKRHNFGLLARV